MRSIIAWAFVRLLLMGELRLLELTAEFAESRSSPTCVMQYMYTAVYMQCIFT